MKSFPQPNIKNKEAERILDKIVGWYPWTHWDNSQNPPLWKPFKEKIIEAMEEYHKLKSLVEK